jgi:hypothetical protein
MDLPHFLRSATKQQRHWPPPGLFGAAAGSGFFELLTHIPLSG